ncbi:MAG: DNA repair protein RecO [bacterium]
MTIKTSGIIIRKLNFGEADKLLTILTRDRGKIRVVAKGVRRPRAKLVGFADMFCYNELMLAEGRNLDIVTAASTIERFVGNDTPLERIGLMYYLCELADKLIEETQEVPGSFELLREMLHYIKNHDTNSGVVKSYFEMKMLLMLGYSPELYKCATDDSPLAPGDDLSFSARLGGILQGAKRAQDDFARSISENTLKFLRILQRYPLEEATKITASLDVLQQVSAVMSDSMEYVLEVRPKSLSVLDELGG